MQKIDLFWVRLVQMKNCVGIEEIRQECGDDCENVSQVSWECSTYSISAAVLEVIL